jgi:hypothetical protein
MSPKLTYSELQLRLAQVEQAFPHEACRTCECFLGYLARLTIDSDPKEPGPAGSTVRSLLSAYKPERKEMHSCLGCDPCPPADHYAAYQRGENTGI